jgi:hypothetical protein
VLLIPDKKDADAKAQPFVGEMTAAQALVDLLDPAASHNSMGFLNEKRGDYKSYDEKCDYHATTYQQALPSWNLADFDKFLLENIRTKHNA